MVKLGFTGVHIIFLISAQNIDCGYSLEPPRRGGSNEYPQTMFWAEIWKYQSFLSENFHFLVIKFSVYLNRHVFVMGWDFLQERRNKHNLIFFNIISGLTPRYLSDVPPPLVQKNNPYNLRNANALHPMHANTNLFFFFFFFFFFFLSISSLLL